MRPPGQLWKPLGRIVAPPSDQHWWTSHASYPTVQAIEGGNIRVFFSTRDRDNRSFLAALDIALDGRTWEVLGPVRGRLFGPGKRGAFDADGVTVTSVVSWGDKLLAYYLGWTVGRGVPFTNFIGLAEADPAELVFRRWSPAPVVGRSRENPFSVGYPWVMRIDGGFRMWFGTHLAWGQTGLDMRHVVKQARSTDGYDWEQDDRIVIPLVGSQRPAEFAISRPVVIKRADGYSMWYAKRDPDYRLGYAWSEDGETWVRDDEAVAFSEQGGAWEAGERTYPCVFNHGGNTYMLYNGRGFGRDGFGLAVLQD